MFVCEMNIYGAIQCVAQFPAKKKGNSVVFDGILILRPPKQSVIKNKHLRYELMVLVGFSVEKRAKKNGFCSGE